MTHGSKAVACPVHGTSRPVAVLLAAVAMALPLNAGADWTRARDAFEAGRYAEAVTELEPLAKRYPNHPGTQAFLGIARLRAGDAAGAITPLERAVADPDRPDYRLFLALALLHEGHPGRALDQLEAVTGRLPPNFAKGADQLLAVAAVRSSDDRRANRLLRRAVDPESGAPEPWIALGVLARRRGDPAEAAKAFRRASQLDPDRRDLARAAAASALIARGESLGGTRDEALRQVVERVEGQLARPGSSQHRQGSSEHQQPLGAGIVWVPAESRDGTDCTMPDDHRYVPGRLTRDPAPGGLSRSAAPPD